MALVPQNANTDKEECTVYVFNIDLKLPEQEFQTLLQGAGTVVNFRFFAESDATRQCIVQYENAEAAKVTVLTLNDMLFGSHVIRAQTEKDYKKHGKVDVQAEQQAKLMQHVPTTLAGAKFELTESQREEVSRTVYVGNLNPNVTEEVLTQFFNTAGKVVFLKFSHTGPGATSRYAFVEFATQKGATDALHLDGRPVGHMPIKVGKATQPIVKPERVQQQLQAMGINRGTNAASMYGTREQLEKTVRPAASRRDIMRYVRAHVEALEHKHGKHPSRSSRSRSPPLRKALRKGSGPAPQQGSGMVWDGFQWHAASAPAAKVAVQQEQKMMGY